MPYPEKFTKANAAYIIIGLAFLLSLFGKDKYDKYRLKNEGQVTYGTIINTSTGQRGTCYIVYSFSVGDSVIRGSYPSSKSKAALNDTLSILYLPPDPSINAPACDILGLDKVSKYP